jgi:hypothetical protein
MIRADLEPEVQCLPVRITSKRGKWMLLRRSSSCLPTAPNIPRALDRGVAIEILVVPGSRVFSREMALLLSTIRHRRVLHSWIPRYNLAASSELPSPGRVAGLNPNRAIQTFTGNSNFNHQTLNR